MDQDQLDKKLEKIQKKIGKEKMDEMDSMSVEQLERVVLDSQKNMATAKKERDENKSYIGAKSVINDLNSGLREVNKVNNAQIEYALHRLEEKGKM